MTVITCDKCLDFSGSPELVKTHKLSCDNTTTSYKAEPPKTVTVQPQLKPQEIKLTYLFTGQCDVCAGPITTLEMDVEKKHFVVAYCTRCKKQCNTREVVKL